MKEKISHHIETIAFAIQSHENTLPNINGGLPGTIIFYFHLHKLTKEERYYTLAVQYLEKFYDILEQGLPNSYLYSSGLGGIAWFLEYISQFIDIDNEFDTEEFDAAFFEAANEELHKRNFEFLSGFSGILLYLLKKKNRNNTFHQLTSFIDKLHDEIFANKDPLNFFQQQDDIHQFPSINLGVSHGIYGLVAMLNKVYAKGINPEKCKAILELIIQLTQENKKDFYTVGYFFPNRVGEGIKTLPSTRLAWCYGDLGILSVLYQTSMVLKDEALEKEVLDMLKLTSHRKDATLNLLDDVWLCHGTSGAAHIYKRLYMQTGIQDFKFASDYWYQKTLHQLDKGHLQIQKNLSRSGRYARKDLTGFLIGYSGLGLALISSISPHNPDWDEMILLS